MLRKMIQKLRILYARILFRLKRECLDVFSTVRLDYHSRPIYIFVNNLREYETRAHSCAKEPETTAWLQRFATSDDLVFDIGANIGAYSLVAAACGAQVYAFEPAFQNFYTLNRNITLNHFDALIKAFPVAFSSKTLIDDFVYLDTTSGTSLGFYNQARKFHRDISHPEVEKATLIFSLDDFVATFGLAIPTLLKIDVDGAEREVLEGAMATLRNPRLRSVLVEIDHTQEDAERLVSFVCAQGFVLESTHVRDTTTNNYIFVRNAL